MMIVNTFSLCGVRESVHNKLSKFRTFSPLKVIPFIDS